MKIELESVLLGSQLTLDATAWAMLTVVMLLFGTMWRVGNRAMRRTTAASVVLGLSVLGAIAQILADELLLFLAGGAVLGFAMLALELGRPHSLSLTHAKSFALLLIASDLALLELAMLLAKDAPAVRYPEAATAFARMGDETLLRFCFIVGFGSRFALPLVCISAYRRSGANLILMPGWLIVGLCSAVGAVRLGCAGASDMCRDTTFQSFVWWVPLLVIVALGSARLMPLLVSLFVQIGSWATRCRSSVIRSTEMLLETVTSTRLIGRAETRLSEWPFAMGTLLVLLCACAMTLLVAGLAE